MFFSRPIEVMRKFDQMVSRKLSQRFAYFQPPRSIHQLRNRPVNNLNITKGYISLISKRAKVQVKYSVEFHTSRPAAKNKKGLPPEIWVVVFKALRNVVFASSMGLKALLQSRRGHVLNKVYINMRIITLAGVVFGLLGFSFYVTHLEECPITKRKKFLIISEKQIEEMALQESENIFKQYRGKVFRTGEQHRQVLGISHQILKANRHLPGVKKDWKVFVINENVLNAFVLPSGHIFIFRGMIETIDNEDQLAAVMGHEIAHALLNHVGEIFSKTSFFQLILILTMVILWVIHPNAVSDSSQTFAESMSEILFKLPMSRKLETEADVVGVQMMARACYDPREAVELWKKMGRISQGEPIEWFSTHPSHKTRTENLRKLMPEAMGIYSKHCKP